MNTEQLATEILNIAQASEKSMRERRIEIQMKLIKFERDTKIEQINRMMEVKS